MSRWRLICISTFAVILFVMRHPYLEPREVPELLMGVPVGRSTLLSEMLGEAAYYSMLLPTWVKLSVLPVVFGELATRQISFMLQDLKDTPFLTLGRDGVSGRTLWGHKRAKWSDISTVTRLTTRRLLGASEQLVISTRLLAEPRGPRAWLRRAEDDLVPVEFVTPSAESAQIEAIVSELRRRRPEIRIRAEWADARPAWWRD